ncbi:uncharacterized protein LODBEIA_P54460 [Lodderomyces beijingensis]|uniref:Uncharacterized protein n=1 Tax=Lodderomyces beijingensis TaxID=1775926 RepID=A0ABP0ZW97_9ASCO
MLHTLLKTTRTSLALQLHSNFKPLRLLTTYSKNPQIFIHEKQPNYFTFSLSRQPESIPIGTSQSTDPAPLDFHVDSHFKSLLDKTLADKIYNDFTFVMEAGTNANSFMPVYDFREIPRYSRTPYIEDVFGYVQVDDKGNIVPGSWQKNDMYEICSGKTGLCKFSDYMYETLQEEVEKEKKSYDN